MDMHQVKIIDKKIENFYKRLTRLFYTDQVVFKAEYSHSKDPVAFKDRLNGKFKKAKEGDEWGSSWDSAWFHLKADVPKSWKGKTVALHLDLNGEALVHDKDGNILQGMTSGSVFLDEYKKDRITLIEKCKGGEKVELWVEAAANTLFGIDSMCEIDNERAYLYEKGDPRRYGEHKGVIKKLRLCLFDKAIWHLWLDIDVLHNQSRNLPEDSILKKRIIRNLNDAIEAFGESVENTEKARKILKKQLSQKASTSDLSTACVGHAHIDTGWLWPVRETIRKCARTFSSQIALMEEYPEFIFGASQPQHYAFVKEHYPELYKKIKKYVKKGNWELQGAMWVEADCNIISGESMVRQVIHGKNYFMDEFGEDVKNLWLPDVFGYSAAMPQILKKAGVDYFVTQKISWSQFNEFPHTTFNWRGIDGTEILTHFPPENNYNSLLTPERLTFARKNFKENDYIDSFLTLFGVGDGGGGAKEEFIERGLRQANLEGSPKVEFKKAQDYLDTLPDYNDELALWVGELYLELHRGTLTTQGRTKLGNRKLEQKLRQLEALCSCLPLDQYPIKELDAIWKTVLINQFHDIIPGSSITKVYEVTEQEYADALADCNNLIRKTALKLFKKGKDSLVLFNCLSHEYDDPVELPEDWGSCKVIDAQGVVQCSQTEAGRTVVAVKIPALSFITLKKGDAVKEKAVPKAKLVLENEFVSYEFNKDATLKSIYDKEIDQDVLEPGKKGNLFSLYADHPNNWDAWDIDIFYEDHLLEHAAVTEAPSVVACGEVRNGLKFSLKIGNSTIEQTVYLSTSSKRLDFNTSIDWNEKHRMLRVAFPVDLQTDKASFDIQYGYVERTTHRNTSWDMAKFEVAAHRYADISETNYGVALLNDCKYGHKVLDNVLDLNILRAPTIPDPDADEGLHQLTYSILPHTGNLINSPVYQEAAKLNMGIGLIEGVNADSMAYPVSFDGDGISLEVVKKAEKEDCIVVRFVETDGKHSTGTLTVNDKNSKICETDLMEWNDGKAASCKKPVQIKLKPFEIKTYKIK